MEFTPTSIPEVILVAPQVFGDQRGFFMETYQARRYAGAGIPTNFVQDNHSGSSQGILRGLHYQIKHPQGKLVRVIAGEVYDVAVDLRRSSRTCGRWVGHSLSAENKLQLWIPPGFAHGFFVVSEWAEVLYKATDYYMPEYERTIIWNDPDLAIEWPFNDVPKPKLSAKDQAGDPFSTAELFD